MEDKLVRQFSTHLLDKRIISKQLVRLLDLIKDLISRLCDVRKLRIDKKSLFSSVSDFSKVTKRLIYYFRIWLLMSKNSFMVMLSQKKLLTLFLAGKLVRFTFFAAFLYYLVIGADNLAGYTVGQTVFFFLTFNVIDILAQFLFREVYRFRQLVVSGDLDLVLVKPQNVLFRVLMGGADIIDLITIPPLLFAVWYVGRLLNPSILHTTYYLLLVLNGLLIATAFHIAVLSLGVITLEIDHTIMIFRDLTNLGRLPVDIYKQPLRGILTFLIPVGIMITLPAKAIMGFVTFYGVVLSFVLGVGAIFVSLRFWNFALKHYTSASS
jgi:ABC-2 type transport system permease protein